MYRLSFGIWAALAISVPASCAPVIYPHSILNAASYFAPGLPAGAIAQGSLFTIFGSGIGPATGTQQISFPLQTSFGGVSIQVTQGTTTVNAIPVFVVQGQVNAIMPSNAPLGWVSLKLTFSNAPSNPSPVYIVHDSPGVFSVNGTGIGPGVLQNALGGTNLPVNSNQASAKPGGTEVLYLTGLGPIAGSDTSAPPAANLPTQVEVWVGGIPATVTYSGRSPCCSGLDQIDFVVPANAPTGCFVPVSVRTSKATLANFTSMAIDPRGAACSDAGNPLSAAVTAGGSVGVLSLTRMSMHESIGVTNQADLASDFVKYSTTKQTGSPWAFAPWVTTPPAGTCTVYPGTGDFLATGAVPAANAITSGLDAGKQLTVSGPSGQQPVTFDNGQSIPLGSSLSVHSFPNRLFLNPGSYTVTGPGGAAVGSLKATLTVPAAFTWTNRDQITNVNRSQPLTLNWSGVATGGSVAILGVDSDLPSNSSAMFFCMAPAGATSFTVPSEVLSAIPATEPDVLASKSVIYMMSSSSSAFAATGLTTGLASAVYMTGATVIFQ
ncbi:MAG TPA: hypothetical protein VFW44_01965 [Bryobacteraceae bacterium]|nr:hypothetical protein [Bryobacteraceae bacterium]